MITKPEALKSLQISAQSGYTQYGPQEQDIYLNCHIKAPQCPGEQRKPIDLAIVLDCSGSMSGGGKLDLCKDTIKFLMEVVSSQDRLSLITYDTRVKTRLPLTRMDDLGQKRLKRVLKGTSPGSATNLSGGLLEGIQQVQQEMRDDGGIPNPVQSVILLTDGQANCGITQTDPLMTMVRNALQPHVSLFTFGYGSGDHDAELLQTLSDVGHGMYYFVENVDTIGIAFADCLGGLLSVVAQNLKVECTARNGYTIKTIKTKKVVKDITQELKCVVHMGDLYGEEERDLLIQVKAPAKYEGDERKEAMRFKVTYADIIASSLETSEASVMVFRSRNLGSPTGANDHVIQQQVRVMTAETLERAQVAGDEGRIQDGKRILDAALSELSPLRPIANDYMEELTACLQKMTTRESYERTGKMEFRARKQAHFAQRGANLPEVVDYSRSGTSRRSCYPQLPSGEVKPKKYDNASKLHMRLARQTLEESKKQGKK